MGKRGYGVGFVDEIHIDVQTYGRHPDCYHLIFVVVDAARDIPDPRFIEEELSGVQNIDGKSLRVLVYVREP